MGNKSKAAAVDPKLVRQERERALNDIERELGRLSVEEKQQWEAFLLKQRDAVLDAFEQETVEIHGIEGPYTDISLVYRYGAGKSERQQLLQHYAQTALDVLAGAEVPHSMEEDQVEAFLQNVPAERRNDISIEPGEGNTVTAWEKVGAWDISLTFGRSHLYNGQYTDFAYDDQKEQMRGPEITIDDRLRNGEFVCSLVLHETAHSWMDMEIWREALLQHQVECAVLEERQLPLDTPPEALASDFNAEVQARIAAIRGDSDAIRAGHVSRVPEPVLQEWIANSPAHNGNGIYANYAPDPYSNTRYFVQPVERDAYGIESGEVRFAGET